MKNTIFIVPKLGWLKDIPYNGFSHHAYYF